jgi:hypothetical protein
MGGECSTNGGEEPSGCIECSETIVWPNNWWPLSSIELIFLVTFLDISTDIYIDLGAHSHETHSVSHNYHDNRHVNALRP